MKLHVVAILSLLAIGSRSYSYQSTKSLGRGGSILFENNEINYLLNNPSNFSSKFKFENVVSLDASESLVNLSKENPEIEDGTYEERIQKYYGELNQAKGFGGVGFSFKGVGFFPLIYLANGEAIISNPAYPEGSALINISEGWGFGISQEINDILFGASFIDLSTKTQISTANVLDYNSGVLESLQEEQNQIMNFALGYKINPRIKIVSVYQKNSIDKSNSFKSGIHYKKYGINYYLEAHDFDSKFENTLHLGIDYSYKNIIVSAGLNQLYPTLGLGLKTKLFELNLAYGGANQFEQFRRSYNFLALSLAFGYL